jgi:hypothetical protein
MGECYWLKLGSKLFIEGLCKKYDHGEMRGLGILIKWRVAWVGVFGSSKVFPHQVYSYR